MTGLFTLIGFVSLLIVANAVPLPANQNKDEAEIRELQVQQATAWNRHDATSYAKLFTEDGDVVNVVGWWWKGRSEIEKKLTAAFAYVFKESTLAIEDVQIRFLTPEIAIAHVRWTMSGAKTPRNIPEPRQGIQLQILVKQSNQWMIASFQNTSSAPEVPFPTGPPASPRSSSHDGLQLLHGSWKSDLFTVSIDKGAKTYQGISLGERFSHTFEVIEARANYMVLKLSKGSIITAQFQTDGSLLLTKQGGMPITVVRVIE